MGNTTEFREIHLNPYINEIRTNAKWALSLIKQGDNNEGFEKVKYYSLAVSTAAVIVQLAYNHVATREAKELADKRIDMLDTKYPNKPEMPNGLRGIRNSVQHFDERIDTWLFKECENGFVYIVDEERNIETYSTSSLRTFERKMINSDELQYWNHTVNIKELNNWCNSVLLHYTNDLMIR